MAEPIRTLVALDTGISQEFVERALPRDADVQIVGIVEGLDDSWTTLQETPTDLFVVACAGYSDRAIFLIEGAVRQRPDRPVVVFTHGSPNGFLRRLFEAGADDVVMLPRDPDDVRFVLQKAMARKVGVVGSSVGTSPLVCILGPKGGTGKTLTATNVAVSLAHMGENVVLVDLDLQFGDVGLCLGLSPDRTIYDLVRTGGTLDADKLDAYLTQHSSGARVLLGPSRPDQASIVSVELLREVYRVLRATAGYIVVDTPPGFTPEVIATIDSSTEICMVGMLDSLSLKNTKLGLETLQLMGYADDRIRIVLNRAHTRVGITSEDVAAILGREPDVLVPSDRDIPRTINEGMPIALTKPNSEAGRAFRRLAETLVRAEEGRAVSPEVHSPGPLRRLIGRRA